MSKKYQRPRPETMYGKEWLKLLKSSDSILGDIMLGINKPTTVRKDTNYQKNADGFIYLCPKCDTCWEWVHEGWKQRQLKGQNISCDKITRVNFYDDFPKMGKTKKICKKCL